MTVYTTKTIVVTITGTNGDFTAAFDSYNIGNDGEHLKTKFDIVLPTAWNVFIATTPASFISVEYKNAKGRCGRSANIAVPALITTHISYEIPRDALYSGETEFWFTVTQPIDATESRITKTAVVRCNVANGYKAGTVPDPFGHDIIQQLLDADAALVIIDAGLRSDIDGIAGTLVWDPANLVDGAGETSGTITATGAAFGDYVQVSAPYDLRGILCNGYVSAANTVKIRIQNETGGAINLASGTWKVKVTP